MSAAAVRNRIAEAFESLTSDEGQTMTEYGVLLALITVVVIGVLALLGGQLTTAFTSVSDALL